jgi:hypothetical protein
LAQADGNLLVDGPGIPLSLTGSIYELNPSIPAFYYPDGAQFGVADGTRKVRILGYAVSGNSLFFAWNDGIWEYVLAKAPWKRVADLGAPRAYPAVSATGDDLWVVGGMVNGLPSPIAERIRLTTGAVQGLPNIGAARAGAASVIYKGAPVILGGLNTQALRTSEVWDNARTRWTLFPPMTSARAYPAAVVFGERIFVFGGLGERGALDSYEVYDAQIGWRHAGKMPRAIHQAAAVRSGNTVVLAGGITNDGPISRVVYALNPPTGEGTELPPTTVAPAAFSLNALSDGSLLALFGWDGEHIANTYEVLKEGASSWEQFRYTVFPRYGAGTALSGARIYFAGGVAQTLGVTSLVDSFKPLPVYAPLPPGKTSAE